MPHYGATLLRVYERRADRRRYAFFAVWATLAIWATFVAGVYERTIGSLFVYLTWSPWHYTGQNYGLAVLFLRKRGVDVAPATKRWIHASFVTSYLLVFLAMPAYESALAVTPTARAWSGLGALRAQQGDLYGARQSYESSLALGPTADAWFGIGLLREVERDAPGALEAYESALALDASHVGALAQSGRWWLAREEPERGRELLERAASLAPDDPRIRADLARLDSRAAAR